MNAVQQQRRRNQRNKLRIKKKKFAERLNIAKEQFLSHMKRLAIFYSRDARLSEEDKKRQEVIRSMTNWQRHQWQKSVIRGSIQSLKDVEFFTKIIKC